MDLFKPKTLTGEWFPFGDGELLVRLIPADVDARLHGEVYGKDTKEEVLKRGGEHEAQVLAHRYLLARACYALMDTRNIWAPAEMAPALMSAVPAGAPTPERRSDGMARLDGCWIDDVKRQILGELMERGLLGFVVLDCSKSLATKAEEKKKELGKA